MRTFTAKLKITPPTEYVTVEVDADDEDEARELLQDDDNWIDERETDEEYAEDHVIEVLELEETK